MRLSRVSPLILVIGLCVAATSPDEAVTAAQAANATFSGSLPVSPGQTVVISQGNGPNAWDHVGPQQYAFDFVIGQQNFVITAAQGGTIIGLNDTSNIQCSGLNWESSPINQELTNCWTHANFVLIKDDDGITASLYMHLLQGSTCSAQFCVKVGDHVRQGDSLARAGTTGWSTGTHLHFQAESIPVPQQDPYTGWWFTNSVPARFTNPEVTAQDSDGIPQTGQMFKLGAAPRPAPTQFVVKPESCGQMITGVDGSGGPIVCPDGHPSLAADRYFRELHFTILNLGSAASLKEVDAAMCKDARSGVGSLPMVADAAQLAEAEQAWHYGNLDPWKVCFGT